MREMICIVCPNGCRLSIDENEHVSGNTCKRGEEFAIRELHEPLRTVSSTVRTVFPDCPVVPVKTQKEIPKGKIFEVMEQINRTLVDQRMGIGETVIKNVCDTEVDVVLTSNILKEEKTYE